MKLLGHRYYDSSTGRFLTRDPAYDGRNWYGYGAGETAPTHFVDPNGHFRIILFVAAAIIKGGARIFGRPKPVVKPPVKPAAKPPRQGKGTLPGNQPGPNPKKEGKPHIVTTTRKGQDGVVYKQEWGYNERGQLQWRVDRHDHGSRGRGRGHDSVHYRGWKGDGNGGGWTPNSNGLPPGYLNYK